LAALVLVGLAHCAGCQTWDLSKRLPWTPGENGEPQPPLRLIAVWTDTVLHQPNKPAVRGFGGRITFYGNKESTEPIPVDGSLVVYAFDEANRDPLNVTPDRKFVFNREWFEKQKEAMKKDKKKSKDKNRHSYSVWIPWDAAGGEQKEISLIARFTPTKGGGTVVGEQTRQILPGAKPLVRNTTVRSASESLAQGPAGQAIQQAAYAAPLANDPQAKHLQAGSLPAGHLQEMPARRMETVTIPLPERFGRHTPAAEMGPLAALRHDRVARVLSEAQQSPLASPTAQPSAQARPWEPAGLPNPSGQQEQSHRPSGAPNPTQPNSTQPYSTQQSGHSGFARFQPLGAPIVRPDLGHGPWPRSPAGSSSIPGGATGSAP
jgi:hypothetical protein